MPLSWWGGWQGRLLVHQEHCLPPTLCWPQLVPPLVPSPISSLWQPCVHHHWAVLILSPPHPHPLTLVFTFTSRSQKVRGKGVAGIWSKQNLPTGSVSSFGIGYFSFLHLLSVVLHLGFVLFLSTWLTPMNLCPALSCLVLAIMIICNTNKQLVPSLKLNCENPERTTRGEGAEINKTQSLLRFYMCT